MNVFVQSWKNLLLSNIQNFERDSHRLSVLIKQGMFYSPRLLLRRAEIRNLMNETNALKSSTLGVRELSL